MASRESVISQDLVFHSPTRAFFVYYVAMALVFFGPRLNPEAGLPIWLGTILGFIIVIGVIYLKYSIEYRITPQGLVKIAQWPSVRQQLIPWERLGEVTVTRGLVQSLLQVGNLSISETSGSSPMFWYGLGRPQEVKEMIEARRP